jgi:hypothetical protein
VSTASPAEPLECEVRGRLPAQQAECRVQLVGGELVDHLGGGTLPKADFDAGKCLTEPGQQAGYINVPGRQQLADPDVAAPRGADRLLPRASSSVITRPARLATAWPPRWG